MPCFQLPLYVHDLASSIFQLSTLLLSAVQLSTLLLLTVQLSTLPRLRTANLSTLQLSDFQLGSLPKHAVIAPTTSPADIGGIASAKLGTERPSLPQP